MDRDISRAIENNDIDYIKTHINQDNINNLYAGRTCLLRAVYHNREKIVRQLIECGADINKRDTYNVTALIVASFNNMEKIVEILLEQNCDVGQICGQGRTALHDSTSIYNSKIKESVQIGKLLLRAGADPYLPDNKGTTYIDELELSKYYTKKDV